MNDTERLEHLIEIAYSQAKISLLGTRQQLLTCFVLLREDGAEIIGTPWNDDAEKRAAILAIGMSIIRSKEPVLAYSMLTECWTSHYKGDEKRRADRPEHDPERREAVLCLASTGTEHKFSSWVIERDAEGRCANLVEHKEPGQFTSRMTNALDKAMELANFKRTAVRNQHNN
jgi:hypothetical protein